MIYKLPHYLDPEGNNVKISIKDNPLPNFISFDYFDTFYIMPSYEDSPSVHTIIVDTIVVELNDNANVYSESFILTVIKPEIDLN